MIKGKTGLTVFLEFVEREGRMPTKEEFIDLGYTGRWFYKVREQYYNYLEEEAKRGARKVEDEITKSLKTARPCTMEELIEMGFGDCTLKELKKKGII